MGVPAIPLSELYRSAIDYIESRGGHVDLNSAPESFQWSEGKRQSNPEVVLISWVVCQAEGVSWSSWVAGKLASRGST
jgi:hypothetical protein